MRVTTLYLVLIAIVLASCGKNDPQPSAIKKPNINNPSPQSFKAPFLPCNCDSDSTEFIKGTFNGARICFNLPPYAANNFLNCNFYKPGFMDQINMIRPNNRNGLNCEFYIINSNVFNRRLPYVMPHANLAYCENVQISMMDRAQPWVGNTICYGCPDDDYNYFGITTSATNPNGFFTTVTDTTGGFLKGTFYGKAFTKTGKELNIENGTFNVRILKITNP
jgi:hypothetical protein